MMIPRRITAVCLVLQLFAFSAIIPGVAGCSKDDVKSSEGLGPAGTQPASTEGRVEGYPSAFSRQSLWDDGLSEMCYYQVVDTIYGLPRRYVRVMLLNREWLNPVERVKSDHQIAAANKKNLLDAGRDIPVFKLSLIEEIPTQNYNYRYMVTVFLNRETLEPEKLAASSQEWCGTTFRQFQWMPDVL